MLGCFEPGVQSEIWQALSPWGSVQTRTPGVVVEEGGEPVEGPNGPLTISATVDYATELANLAEGECTFSHDADLLLVPRQCLVGGHIVPPPPGKMMYPFGLAAHGQRIYVADQYNHRVQVFDFDGTPISIARPIGNGVPGLGQYTVPSTGVSGQMLRSPEGLAVDGAGHVLVADSWNSRIAIFNSDGSVAFGSEAAPVNKQILDTVAFEPTIPAGVAVSPGAVVLAPGTPVPTTDDRRIVVSDRDRCFVYIYDLGFNLLHQVPPSLPDGHAQGACVYPDGENPVPPGVFGTATGVAVDAANRIYVADYDNSRVTILDKDGGVLGSFGEAPPGGTPGPESLQAPWGLIVDHLGRVVITDSDNQRISFFSVDFSGVAPVAAYLFQLNAAGTLNGFPTGIAEQVGAVEDGLDPAGRILTTDTQHHRIQRFQLPDLAIVKPAASGGVGTFEVVVPVEKADDVNATSATVVPVVPGSATIDSVTALPPAQPASNDIGPGQTVKYTFTYTSANPIVTFRINASGNGDNTHAPEVQVTSTAPCGDCGAGYVVYNHPIAGAPVAASPITVAGDDWYGQRVVLRVTPTGTDVVTHIAWLVAGQAVADHGGWVHLTPVVDGFADITFLRAGLSAVSFWPMTVEGTTGMRQDVRISIDLEAPQVAFANFTPVSGTDSAGVKWNNTNVTASYIVVDAHSGSATPGGSISLTAEGRNQFVAVDAIDNVGHESTVLSNFTGAGGRQVNIDKTPPVINAPASLTLTENATGGAVIPPGTFDAVASDPALPDSSAGSGVVLTINPGTFVFPLGTTSWQFVATDAAGNSTTVTRDVTVRSATSSIASPNASVEYGQTLNVTASVTPAIATGSVTFTLGARTQVATLSGGVASTSFAILTSNVGVHTMQVSYAGGVIVPAASTTAQITVTPRPATVTADNQQKVAGNTDPVLTVTSSGFLASDGISFSATRIDGETAGTYAITPSAAGAALGNYAVTYVPGVFTIVGGAANQPPICTTATGGEIGPPNHKKFYATPITGVTDPDGGAITILVTGIWQDEVIDSTGDGKFAPDGQGVGTNTAWVRAERNGHGNKATGDGRLYEILFTATDHQGASCTGSVLWTVPHDQGRGGTAIDSGVRYDSTGLVPGARNKSQIHKQSQ